MKKTNTKNYHWTSNSFKFLCLAFQFWNPIAQAQQFLVTSGPVSDERSKRLDLLLELGQRGVRFLPRPGCGQGVE